jgi:dimethylamine monooxygenase subunit A
MNNELNVMHTPYDGSSKPFTIGLRQLDFNEWIEVDGHLAAYLDEKDRLAETICDQVIVAEPGSEPAQAEILELVANHVCDRFPETYSRHGNIIRIKPASRSVDLSATDVPKVHVAARLVQEDLVLMLKDERGWHLAAASVCFPSAWTLREKFGKPMHEIHRPVPGFSQGTRNAGLIERMFDNLSPARPVIRWNWSLYGDANLHHPVSDHGMKQRFGEGFEPQNINLRLERQTLRKLPETGGIVFTIRIHIDPLDALESHADGPALAVSIAGQLAALSPDEIAYKGLAGEHERLAKRLNAIAGLPPKV